MRSLTEVNGKLIELHNALGQVITFLGKTQGEIASLKASVGGILGEPPTVRVVRQRKRKATVRAVPVVAQPNGPDGAAQAAPTAETPPVQPAAPRQAAPATRKGKGGWPKGLKRGPRKTPQVPEQQEAAA